ncbi:MAG: hypothetical protein OHK93_001924 [Ramalina farinacea]|uniref:Dihydrolipoamide acetyltransferase component of pyruvate dehydrogenase complex n=1 Tax=Ramalina farinacea TaxID=258253 RepID=A0AA43QQG4_9LECA|nr:hypothetical protein [Ramalina farinacea]
MHSRPCGSFVARRRAFHPAPRVPFQRTPLALLQPTHSRFLHTTSHHHLHPTPPHLFQPHHPNLSLQPFHLSDPGEGIKEVQIIQWFVEPGARVEQFDKICEVASDKANVEITSRYDGVVRRLRWEQDDVVPVGGVLCDIDVEGEETVQAETGLMSEEPIQAGGVGSKQQPQKAVDEVTGGGGEESLDGRVDGAGQEGEGLKGEGRRHASLATPAVRGLLKELKVDIRDVKGTGKDGRVLKEDVHRYAAEERDAKGEKQTPESAATKSTTNGGPPQRTSLLGPDAPQVEEPIALTPIQAQMFKTMTRSLSIPHFLYADELDITALSALRQRLNDDHTPSTIPTPHQKLSYLPFIIKALSLALLDFPLLNARIAHPSGTEPPQLILRTNHNIGIAMDTPQGLLVPNIKNVAARSISDIAVEISRLQGLAKDAKLTAKDLTGGTITVSNIGSIGGTYVAPLIVASEVAILGVGKARVVPAFVNEDDDGDVRVRRKEVMNFSWSADHRVVDGATMARMAERVRGFVQRPETMIPRLR